MPAYVLIEPEVAGQIGEQSEGAFSGVLPAATRLHYEFEDWAGDDLVTAMSHYIVTTRLADLLRSSGWTGFRLDEVIVTVSEEAEILGLDASTMPRFSWLRVTGSPGVDDLGLTSVGDLVVAGPAWETISSTMTVTQSEVSTWQGEEAMSVKRLQDL